MRMRLSLFGLLRSSGSCASKLKNLPDRDPPGAIIDVFEGQALGRSARILVYIYLRHRSIFRHTYRIIYTTSPPSQVSQSDDFHFQLEWPTFEVKAKITGVYSR